MWRCTNLTKNTGDFQASKGSELSEPRKLTDTDGATGSWWHDTLTVSACGLRWWSLGTSLRARSGKKTRYPESCADHLPGMKYVWLNMCISITSGSLCGKLLICACLPCSLLYVSVSLLSFRHICQCFPQITHLQDWRHGLVCWCEVLLPHWRDVQGEGNSQLYSPLDWGAWAMPSQ